MNGRGRGVGARRPAGPVEGFALRVGEAQVRFLGGPPPFCPRTGRYHRHPVPPTPPITIAISIPISLSITSHIHTPSNGGVLQTGGVAVEIAIDNRRSAGSGKREATRRWQRPFTSPAIYVARTGTSPSRVERRGGTRGRKAGVQREATGDWLIVVMVVDRVVRGREPGQARVLRVGCRRREVKVKGE